MANHDSKQILSQVRALHLTPVTWAAFTSLRAAGRSLACEPVSGLHAQPPTAGPHRRGHPHTTTKPAQVVRVGNPGRPEAGGLFGHLLMRSPSAGSRRADRLRLPRGVRCGQSSTYAAAPMQKASRMRPRVESEGITRTLP